MSLARLASHCATKRQFVFKGIDFNINFATILPMLGRPRTQIHLVVAITAALQIGLVTVIPTWSYDGLLVKSGDAALGKSPAQCLPRSRQCASAPSLFGLNKIAGAANLPLSSSALRFDLKQNLSTWPVLSNDLERSPPLLLSPYHVLSSIND